jgi:hypothetical protein
MNPILALAAGILLLPMAASASDAPEERRRPVSVAPT